MGRRNKTTEDIIATDSRTTELTDRPLDALSHLRPSDDGNSGPSGATECGGAIQQKVPALGAQATPDPITIRTIALTDAKEGPSIRLLRCNKYQQMQIQFDEQPDETVRAQLSSYGWRSRSLENVWTRQVDPDASWRVHADSEKLFCQIAERIRANKGLASTMDVGG